MINFEEELAKYKPSKEIENLEDEIFQRDLTDMTDILFQMMQQGGEKKPEKKAEKRSEKSRTQEKDKA